MTINEHSFAFLSLGSLVNLAEQKLKDFSWHLLDLRKQQLDRSVRLLLICVENVLQIQLCIKLLDLCHLAGVVLSIVLLQHLALLGRDQVQRLHNQPRALVVLDVSSHLANDLGRTVAVQVVVLDLEILAHDQQDLASGAIETRLSDARHDHAQCNWQIEAVKRGLVLDNGDVSVESESIEVDDPSLRLRSQVEQLAQLGLASDLDEKVHQLRVETLVAEILLENLVHAALQDEAVVDRDQLHFGQAEPARLPSASHAVIHDVVRHQEKGLQELHAPPQCCGLASFLYAKHITACNKIANGCMQTLLVKVRPVD